MARTEETATGAGPSTAGDASDPADDAADPADGAREPADGVAEPADGVAEPADRVAEPADDAAGEACWSRIRRRVFIGWSAALLLIIVFVGIPTDRGSMLLLVLTLLAIPCLGRGWRAYLQVLLDWIPFTLVLLIYDYSRGIAARIGMPLHMSDIAAADRALFGGTVPTVWLQERFLHPGDPRWWDGVATLTYSTHFFATPVIAAILWIRDRALWLAFITRIVALSVAGLVTYVLFPAAPPWYAAREGAIEPVIRASSRGWLELHINHAGNLLQQGQFAANPIAAMPSLHTAFATIIALFAIRRLHSRLRWVVLIYPALMGLSLVYLAEHYVVDLLAGVVYAVAVDLAVSRYERWRDERRAHGASRPAEASV